MQLNKICDSEERRLRWILNFKLPNYFKKVGWTLVILSLISLFATKLFEGDFDLLKTILKNLMLLGLLIVTLSKEKIEDEYIENLRSMAFRCAFILGVIYVLIQPLINYLAFVLVKPDKAMFQDLGDFQILWFLLVFYLTVFWVLKRRTK